MATLPRILIIDDLFGRAHIDRRNEDRANLCADLRVKDITGDEEGHRGGQEILQPIGEAVFTRGQKPACARVGDRVQNDLEGTIRLVRRGWEVDPGAQPLWSLVCLDLCFYTGEVTAESDRLNRGMPEGRPEDEDPTRYFGLQLLRAIHEQCSDLPVIILSSKPRQEVSREFSTLGALAFLPRGSDRGAELLQDYLWRHGLVPDAEGQIVGHSRPLLLSLRAARRTMDGRRNVLIRGDRGTGKELLARFVNRPSITEQQRPFVVVDSGALDRELYASTLFGHRRGSFTSAHADRTGEIVKADGGDLFLDEIGNMPADVQSGLLRVIETRMVTPVGANAGTEVAVRFLSATNDEIEGRAAIGGFRPDLLDRLREAGTIYVPSLRDRREDIPLLVETFLREAESVGPGRVRRTVEPDAMELLMSHDWPGNVRELRNVVFSAIAKTDVEHLVPLHLAGELRLRPEGRRVVLVPPEASRETREPGGPADDAGDPSRLSDILATWESFDPAKLGAEDLTGGLVRMQAAQARAIGRLLRAALLLTSRRTVACPSGEIRIHPALKLLTGNPDLTASQAADIVKRLVASVATGAEDLMRDPVLREAHETALRLRPRTAKKR